MSLLMILGLWFLASALLSPVVGYYLSTAPKRAAERQARKEIAARLGQP